MESSNAFHTCSESKIETDKSLQFRDAIIPMSSSSHGSSSFHNNGMEGKVVGSKPTNRVCNLPIQLKNNKKITEAILKLKEHQTYKLQSQWRIAQ